MAESGSDFTAVRRDWLAVGFMCVGLATALVFLIGSMTLVFSFLATAFLLYAFAPLGAPFLTTIVSFGVGFGVPIAVWAIALG